MNKKDNLIKRALTEYVIDKSSHYEEKSNTEIQFSHGFDNRVKEKINRPGFDIMGFLTSKTGKLISVAAVFVVIVAASINLLPGLKGDKSVKDTKVDTKMEEAKLDASKEKTDESIEKKAGEEKTKIEVKLNEEAKTEESKTEESKTEEAETKDAKEESKSKESASDAEDAPIVTSDKLSMGLNKPSYQVGDPIGIYIRNETDDEINIDDNFVLSKDGVPMEALQEREVGNLKIPTGSTRYVELNSEKYFGVNLENGNYTLTKEINGVKLELKFEVK